MTRNDKLFWWLERIPLLLLLFFMLQFLADESATQGITPGYPTENFHPRTASSPQTNYALSFFDTNGDYVIVPDHISLNPDKVTVEMWVKFDRISSSPSTIQSLLTKGTPNSVGAYSLRMHWDSQSGPSIRFQVIDRFFNSRYATYTPPFFETSKWYHFAGTFDGSRVRLFVNGELRADAAATNVSLGNTGILFLGYSNLSSSYYFDGQLDEVRIWSYARDEYEIQDGMYQQLTGNETNLLAYWTFDEGSGQIAPDLTGNHNDGQLGSSANVDGRDPAWVISDRPTSGDGLHRVNITSVNPDFFPTLRVTTRIADTTGNAVADLDTSSLAIWERLLRREIVDMTSNFLDSTKADFVFVFDTSASMGNLIDALKARAQSFADSLDGRGIDYALGLVSFVDNPHVFNDSSLTTDKNEFQVWVDGLAPGGGGDRPENSFDALAAAAQMKFRLGAQRIFILITDAPPHTANDPEPVTDLILPEVVAILVRSNVTCHVVGPREPEYLGPGSLTRETGGRFFDVTADFGIILEEIVTFITGQYELTYRTPFPVADGTERQVILRSAQRGRTGADTLSYLAPNKTTAMRLRTDSLVVAFDDEFWVEVVVGNERWPAKGLFSTSFILSYNEDDLVFLAGEPGSAFGNNVLFNARVDTSAGSIHVAATKISGAGLYGADAVARFRFRGIRRKQEVVLVDFCLAQPVAFDSIAVSMPVVLDGCLGITLSDDTTVTVWPGDTNNDGIVNGIDVLYVGLYFSATGPPRENATADWIGQPASIWKPPHSTYADATGNGVVDFADVGVVDLNWGKTHGTANRLVRFASWKKTLPPGCTIAPVATFDATKDEWLVEIVPGGAARLRGIAGELSYPVEHLRLFAVEGASTHENTALVHYRDNSDSGKVEFVFYDLNGGETELNSQTLARIRFKPSLPPGHHPPLLEVRSAVAVNRAGEWLRLVGQSSDHGDSSPSVPTKLALYQNYPNPFNPGTRIRFALPKPEQVKVTIYNVLGHKVRTLVDEHRDAGYHAVEWDGRGEAGGEAPSGIYFIRMQAGDSERVKRIVKLR